MGVWFRTALLLAAPLLLSGCFLLPGKFDSSLRISAGQSFDFAYRGEMVFAVNDEFSRRRSYVPPAFNEAEQRCWGVVPQGGASVKPVAYQADPPVVITPPPIMAPRRSPGVSVPDQSRPCTREELTRLRTEHEQMRANSEARRKKEAEQLARVIGFDPTDEASMRAFAAQLEKQAGWRSVSYKGNGVFAVDYAVQSRLGHEFVFPLLPRGSTIQPFVVIRKRADGAVLVSAPAFVGTGPATLLGLMNNMGGSPDDRRERSHAIEGRFVLKVTGKVLTNNTEDGSREADGATILAWQVDKASDKVPEALIRTD